MGDQVGNIVTFGESLCVSNMGVMCYSTENGDVLHPLSPSKCPSTRGLWYGGIQIYGFLCDHLFRLVENRAGEEEMYGEVKYQGQVYPSMHNICSRDMACMITYFVNPNGITVSVDMRRSEDGEGRVPLNLGFCSYFSRDDDTYIIINGKKYKDLESCVYQESFQEIFIETGKHKITVTLGGFDRKYIAWWSDDPRFFCLDTLLAQPKKFAEKPEETSLGPGETSKLHISLNVQEK